jgi:peptide/nickel transport system substrate-binding protein
MAGRRGASSHPYVPELVQQLRRGAISRRQFLRTASLLGVSAASAAMLGGCGEGEEEAAKEEAPAPAPTPAAEPEAPKGPNTGGTLRVSMRVGDLTDPAMYVSAEQGSIAGHMVEPLVRLNKDNVAEPYLATRWEVSEDLKTWTFHLRQDAKWSNFDQETFNADDVVANFKRWVDPVRSSSNRVRFAALSASGVEKVDDFTVRLHLDRPDLTVPESLAEYPALIVHRKFDEEGGDLAANPVGTGAYKVRDYRLGEHTLLERTRDPAFGFKAEWWGGGGYLDRIRYFDHGSDPAASVAALVADEVDFSHHVDAAQAAVAADSPEVVLYQSASAHTGVMRMKLTEAPFDNPAVRRAVQACVDRDKMFDLVAGGFGAAAEDHHVAPIHPDYAPLPKLAQDYPRARALLAEAGHADGIALAIDCAAEPPWQQAACNALAAMCKPAGITLTVNLVSPEDYRKRRLTTPFGLTGWDHRALGVQVLELAYRTGAPWNETTYANAAFDSLLDEASGILDPVVRRAAMEKVEKTLQNDAVMIQAPWRSVLTAANKRVRDLYAHAASEHHFNFVWLTESVRGRPTADT